MFYRRTCKGLSIEARGHFLHLPIHILTRQGDVDRRGVQAAMTEHLLQHPELHSPLRGVRAECVAHGVNCRTYDHL